MRETGKTRTKVRSFLATLLSMVMLGGVVGVAGVAGTSTPAQAQAPEILPVIFVHGYLGSGAQYRTQAMRFASNGWPDDQIVAIDYSGLNPPDLDGFVDQVRERFGVEQVYMAGHSLGTAVMSGYLNNREQSLKVAAYAALDGIPATCIYGTRCTSITAASMGQRHVEASLSAESFERQYQHFTGQAPQTTEVVPDPGNTEIEGKLVEFSTNLPVSGQGEVWALDPATGQRTGDAPAGAFTTEADGHFGPIPVDGAIPYEIAVTGPDNQTMHFYQQPFTRTQRVIRLQWPSAAVLDNTNQANHVGAVVLRYREWGDGDTIEVTTGDRGTVNVMDAVPSNPAGIHIHDDAATPGQSSLEPLPYFSTQAFQYGVDVFMPATSAADGTVSFTSAPRGDVGNLQTINIRNWPSGEQHGVLVEFNDYFEGL